MDHSTPHPIRAHREEAGLSVRRLAALARVSFVTVSHVENGRVEPRGETLQKLANVFSSLLDRKVTVADLTPEEESANVTASGYTAEEVDASWRKQDVDTYQPLMVVIDGRVLTEQPPKWFLNKVKAAQGKLPEPIVLTAARPRARERRDGSRRKTKSSASSDDGPGEPEPPLLRARVTRDGRWAVYCSFCRTEHFHSPGAGHRVADCLSERSPYAISGYNLVGPEA